MNKQAQWYNQGRDAAIEKYAGKGGFGGRAPAAKPAAPAMPGGAPATPAAPAAPAMPTTPTQAAGAPPAPAAPGAAAPKPGLGGALHGAYGKVNNWLGTPMGSAVGQGVMMAGLPIAMDKLMGNGGQQPQQGF